jgi:indolepyruvate ferredoxin oxidoreductase
MAVDSSQPYPPLDQLRERVDAVSRAASNRYLDVQALAERATGSHLAGNALLLGYAVQTGALPLQPASVEEAIRRSGVAVEQSLGAFAWGRAVAADPSLAEMLLAGRSLPASVVIAPEVAALGLPESLARKVSLRLEDLTAYQNRSYAQRYLDAVAAVARRDREVHPDDLAVTALAAEHLHRMMAYKDEYEVARLHASEASKAAVAAQFGQGARISWKLQPPLLKGLGLHRKVTVGPWFRPAFVALAGLKAVRGTALDPFGHMRIRRIERLLADDMDLVIHTLSDTLRAENYLSAVGLLSAADRVRGYEDVKIRNVQAYLRSRADLSVSLGLPQPDLRLVSLVAGWTWES